MKTRKHQYSFAAGEVSPEFYGRGDSAQYQTGVATARNFVIKPQGSARTRPGLEYVGTAKTQSTASHLIPFSFNLNESYVLAFGHQNVRFYRNGAPVQWATPANVGDPSSAANVKVGTGAVDGSLWQRMGGFILDTPVNFSEGDLVYLSNEGSASGLPSIGAASGSPAAGGLLTVDRLYQVYPASETEIVLYDILANKYVRISALGSSGYLRMWRVLPRIGAHPTHGAVTRNHGRIGSAELYSPRGKIGGSQDSDQFFFGNADEDTAARPNYVLGEHVRVATGSSEAIPIAGMGASENDESEDLYVYEVGTGSFGGVTQFYAKLTSSAPATWVANGGAVDPAANKKTLANAQTGGSGSGTIRRRYAAGTLVYNPTTSGTGSTFYTAKTTFTDDGNFFTVESSNWSALAFDGSLELTTPYDGADVSEIGYDQSGDILTLVHPKYPEQEVKRFGNTYWTIGAITFSPPLAAPAAPTIARTFSQTYANFSEATTGTTTPGGGTSGASNEVGGQYIGIFNDLAAGDILQVRLRGSQCGEFAGANNTNNDPTFSRRLDVDELVVVASVEGNVALTGGSAIKQQVKFSLRTLESGRRIYGCHKDNDQYVLSDLIRNNNKYRIGAVDRDGAETLGAESAAAINALDFAGAKNTLTWASITGADKYIVYRQEGGTGLYEKIGEVVATTGTQTFIDDGLPADGSVTAPRYDSDVTNAENYSRATARFEQRRLFAGSDLFPRRLFLSRSGTESDFSFRIPVLDTDRISVEASAREAHVIRHLVPLGDLLMLTQLGEWRLFAVNSDAITPSTVSIRPQSYVGSSTVRPIVANSSVLFCAARGGHVRQMGYEAARSGFTTGDLSLRAAHLFDDLDIVSSAYQKSPAPVAWFVSSNGKLLGLTYVPEEQVAAWHQHDTDGTFESVTCVSEGAEDRVYVAVKRKVNGVDVRHIERMSTVSPDSPLPTLCLDDALTYVGAVSSQDLRVSSGNLEAGGTVNLIQQSNGGADADGTYLNKLTAQDVGRRVVLSGGYVLEITAFTDINNITAKVITPFPADKVGVRLAYEKTATRLTGLSHLEGETVTIVRRMDQAELGVTETAVVTNGEVTLGDHAVFVDVGRPYTCDLKLLPTTLQMPALGYGREKAVNRAWVRVFEAAGLSVGPDENSLAPVGELQDLTKLATQQTRNIVPSDWDEDASLLIRQTKPFPATIAAVTIEVSVAE